MSFDQLIVLLEESGFESAELSGMLEEYRTAKGMQRRKQEAVRREWMICGFAFGLEAVGVLTRRGVFDLMRDLRET